MGERREGLEEEHVQARPGQQPGADRAAIRRDMQAAAVSCQRMPCLIVDYRFDELDDPGLHDAVEAHLLECHDCHLAYLALDAGLGAFARLAAEVNEADFR